MVRDLRFSRLKKSRRGLITVVCLAASLAASITLAFASWSASAANATFRIDPSTQTVAPGTTFVVNLVVDSDTPLTGVQSTISFDATRLQVVSVDKGTEWGDASLLAGIAPQTRDEAIAEANTTGLLRNVARFKSAGTGTIAPGPKIAAVLSMRTLNGVTGEVPLTVSSLEAIDVNFAPIPTSQQGGKVVISSDPATSTPTGTATQLAPTSTLTPTSTATAAVGDTSTPTATPTSLLPSPTPTDTPGPGIPGTLGFAPANQSVNHGDGFALAVIQNLTVTSSGVVTDVTFDPDLVQLTNVTHGNDYLSADLTVGEAGQSKAQAIAAANLDGTLRMVLVYLSDGTVPPGSAEAFKLFGTASTGVSGLSMFSLKNVTFYATQQISVTRSDALVEVVGPATATPSITLTSTPTNTAVPATSTQTPSPTSIAATNTPGGITGTPVANTATNTATATRTSTATSTSTRTAVASTATTTVTSTSTIGALSSQTVTSTPTPTLASGTTSTTTPTPTTSGGNTSTPTTASGTTSTATTAAGGSPTAAPTVDPASAQAKLSITPPTITAPPGAEFTVILAHESQLKTSGAQADLKFDPALLQVISVDKSQDYQKASLLAGVAPQKPADAIVEANTTGTLKAVGAFFVPPTSLAPGAHEFVRIKMQVKSTASNTTTALTLGNLEMLNDGGEPISVSANNGQLTIQAGAAVPTPPGSSSTVAGTSNSPSRLPSAGTKTPYGELNWALTISLIAMLASGGALVGSLAQRDEP